MMNNYRQDDDSLTLNSEADYSVMMRTNQARDLELNNRLRELENLRTNRREEQAYPNPIDPYMSRSMATSNGPYAAPSQSTDASVSLMRDWMKEKDLEITNLKSQVKAQQDALIQKEIELAVLRERLANQEQRMQHELKMMKMALTTATNKNPKNGTSKSNTGKEIHIQSLHVKVGSDMMQNQYDGKAIQAATQKATAAALEKIVADHENENNNKSSVTQDSSIDIKSTPSNQTFEKSLMLRNGLNNETKEALGKLPETTKNSEQSTAVRNPDVIKFNVEETLNEPLYKQVYTPKESIPPSPAKDSVIIEELLSQDKAVNKFDRNPPQASVSSDSESTDSDDDGDTFDESLPWEKSQYSRKDPRDDDDTMSFDETSIGQTIASSTYGDDREHVRDQKLLDPYGDSGKYTGVILRSTGMPHGVGRMIYDDDGRTYEGDWKHGRWHGHGKATFANRDSYEGEYRADQRHGRGKYEWADGRVYDGEFKEDKRQGSGTFSWPDGAKYIGEFNQGQREGHGQYYFLDGGYYNGSWRDGRYDGFGECHWEDGRTYKGEWRLGMAHGQGVEMYPDGSVRHDGQWIEDEPIR